MQVRLIRDWFQSQCQESEKQVNSRNHQISSRTEALKKSQSWIFWFRQIVLNTADSLSNYSSIKLACSLRCLCLIRWEWTATVHTHIGDKKRDVRGCFRVFQSGVKDNTSSRCPTTQQHTQTQGDLQRLSALTSLKCWLVFMMYGVLSDLSTFIQPWPRNSLQGHSRDRTNSLVLRWFTLNFGGK